MANRAAKKTGGKGSRTTKPGPAMPGVTKPGAKGRGATTPGAATASAAAAGTTNPGARRPTRKSTSRNAALIARFYTALGRRDAEGMIACYGPDATFSDPVFTHLDRDGVAAMWRMLCSRGKDLQVKASGIEADERTGRAHWTASYTYTATGRPVINEIDAAFEFRDGRIKVHQDHFNLWRWTRQALGPAGWVAGLPGFRATVRRRAGAALAAYRAKSAG